jgi:hypothetical protein
MDGGSETDQSLIDKSIPTGRMVLKARIFRQDRSYTTEAVEARSALMRINVWIILGTLLALLAITRYMQHQGDTQRICANDPTASVCER